MHDFHVNTHIITHERFRPESRDMFELVDADTFYVHYHLQQSVQRPAQYTCALFRTSIYTSDPFTPPSSVTMHPSLSLKHDVSRNPTNHEPSRLAVVSGGEGAFRLSSHRVLGCFLSSRRQAGTLAAPRRGTSCTSARQHATLRIWGERSGGSCCPCCSP